MTSSSRSVSASGQARGRLVDDDEPRLERQRLGDLDQLLLRQRQRGDRRVGAKIGAEPVEKRLAPASSGLRSISWSEPARERLAADEDVGGDVEIVEEVEFLVDEGDAARDRARRR